MIPCASQIVLSPTLVVMYVSYSMNPFFTATKSLMDLDDICDKFVHYSFVRPS